MQCRSPAAQEVCELLSEQLHEQSRFALGITHLPQQMTSNMELRIQCGGINGIASCIEEDEQTPPVDIYTLVEKAVAQFGTIADIPYSRVAQSISQWKPKRRGRRTSS